MFDFEVGQIQLGLAAIEKADTRADRRESDGQAFADAATRAGHQHAAILQALQAAVSFSIEAITNYRGC
jgi:hypothetical protein